MSVYSTAWRGLALLAVGVLVGPSCASDSESDVDERVLDQVIDAVGTDELDLDCPDSSEEAITCTVTIEGQDAPVVVEPDAESDGNAPSVVVGALVISRADLEADVTSEVAELLDSEASVACGHADRVVIPTGDSVECTVTSDDGSEGVAVVTAGPDGQPAVVELRGE